MKNIEKYFLEELNELNVLAKDFVKKHPSLANMLASPSTDPDVERLLEGVAYINAFIKREIDESYIKIAKYILQYSMPYVLRPVPSSTILHISPNEHLKERLVLKKGVYFLAELNNTGYKFQNIWDVEIYNADFNVSVSDRNITIKIKSPSKINRLNFFINSSFDKRFILFKYLYECQNVYIKSQSGKRKTELDFIGLKKNVFDYFEYYNPYSLIEEYFIFPEKFFIFALEVGEKECEIVFEFEKNLPFEVSKEDFLINCVPVVNLFEAELDPIELDYKKECIVLNDYIKYDIYDILEVTGFRANQKVHYHKFDGSDKYEHTYEIYDKKILDKEMKCLSIHFNSATVNKEILSIKALALNDNADLLKTGSVNKPSDNTPELINFSNITPVTQKIKQIKDEKLWDFISYLGINLTSIDTVEKLQKLLKLFINEKYKNKTQIYKNIKKIESISDFEIRNTSKIYKGHIIDGFEIVLEINGEFFVNIEEIYLFSLVLQYFLAVYVPVNNFLRLKIKETTTGSEFKCKEITGNKKLI